MIKTAKEIQSDIVDLLRGSKLAKGVNGKIYRYGQRPKDSKSEDIIVIFTAGVPSQIQKGVITINIYCPDVNFADSLVENGNRTMQIERLSQDWVNSLSVSSSNYRFSLQDTITTMEDEEIKQHFTSISLRYDMYDMD